MARFYIEKLGHNWSNWPYPQNGSKVYQLNKLLFQEIACSKAAIFY